MIGSWTALVVGLSVGVGLLAATAPPDWIRVVLAALVGVWPGTTEDIDRARWVIGVGTGVSAFAVFGIPIVLGVVVSRLLRRTERRIRMSILEYLKQRDRFIETEVFRELRVNLDIPEERCEKMAKDAVRRAATAWDDMQDERYARALEEVNMPPSRAPAR